MEKKSKPLTVNLTPTQYQELKQVAQIENRKLSNVAAIAIVAKCQKELSPQR